MVCTGVTGPDTLLWSQAHHRGGWKAQLCAHGGQEVTPDRPGNRGTGR